LPSLSSIPASQTSGRAQGGKGAVSTAMISRDRIAEREERWQKRCS
jgi:hypothetical protein